MKWVICASGPSMLRVDLAHLRGFRTWKFMAVNCTWRLVPWSDVLYAGDGEWWNQYGEAAAAFRGEKWTGDEHAALRFRLKRVAIDTGFGLCRQQGKVNSGGNSGYQAVNLAWHLGARQIVLLGFDMHRHHGAHWHGEHPDGMLSAPESHIEIWRNRFDRLAEDLKAEGVSVINATEGSALACFSRKNLREAMQG